MKKNIIFGLFAIVIFASPLSAATVSFLVIETGITAESPSNRYSFMWENGLLDVFFDAGHIVSNSPMIRLSKIPQNGIPNEAEYDIEDALEGGMQYFIIALIEYPLPYKVTLRLYNTKSREMLQENNYTYSAAKTERDDYENIKKAIREMAAGLR